MTVETEGRIPVTWIHDGHAERMALPVTHEVEPDWDLDFRYVEFSTPQGWTVTFYLWAHDGPPHVSASWDGDRRDLPGWADWISMPEAERLLSVVAGSGRPDSPNLPDVETDTSEGVAALKGDLTSLGLGYVIAPVLTP